MQAVLAIALQTARSALRSRVFLVLMIVTVIATMLLPSSILGDATLAGLFRIKINYSIGIITFLIGLAGLWISTVNVATEIEGYQVHMVLTKPVSHLKLWLGKVLGIISICFILLFASAAFIYYSISTEIEEIRTDLVKKSINILKEADQKLTEKQQMDLNNDLNSLLFLTRTYANTAERESIKTHQVVESPERLTLSSRLTPLLKKFKEFDDLQNEILIGRNHYRWTKPDFYKLAKDVLIQSGKISEATPQEIAQPMIAEQARIQESKNGALPIIKDGQPIPKVFMFENLPKINSEQAVYIKYRIYAGDPLNQKQRNTAVGVAFVDEKGEFITPMAPFGVRTTQFYTERLNPKILEGKTKFGIAMFNLDHEVQHEFGYVKELIIQAEDGPLILIGETSFKHNYWLCVVLIGLFVSFLVMLGTTAGCCFSTPVAILISVSYIFIGVAVSSVLNTEGAFQVVKYEGQLEQESNADPIFQSFHRLLNKCMITVDTFTRMEFISTGRAISWGIIGDVLLFDFILKGLPIFLIGIYVLQRRELGLVIRK